jgi:predicted AlkP superfamily phosphohydrolase/phosphomutase
LVAISVAAAAWASATPAEAYIGPGAGFAVIGSFLALLAAVLLSGVAILSWPMRALVYGRRRRRAFSRSHVDRVVVIGLDGLDPAVAGEMMAAGRLPNLSRLRETGTYARLRTTCPAMSPVAWSSFMTGVGPGRHGIFDFLRRDPRTYLPDLSSAQIRPGGRVGARASVRLLRRSKPFWALLGEHGIPSTVLRVPITFPPERFHGLLLAGMCVPDLRGTQGSFTYFTTAEDGREAYTGGQRIRVRWENGAIRSSLPGPAVAARGGNGRAAQAAFCLARTGDGAVRLDICGQRVTLRPAELSEWVPVQFRVGRLTHAAGICQFLLRQLEPDLQLYVSPINIDPDRPALPISHPLAYSVYLAKRLGRFATLGLAEDTWALNEGVLDDQAFLRQCQVLFEERERMLSNALANTRCGCVVCVFDTTDRVQHMFWQDRAVVEAAYQQADAMVGRVMSQLGPRDALIVISDHGFAPFRRGVNLNAWLLREGYLALQPGATGEAEWLREVDWGRTRAYALGLGGLYLNVRGREAKGTVAPGQAQALREELVARLSGLVDEDGRSAVAKVFDTRAVNPGPYTDAGPDLVVGYAPGYRASWDAAVGKAAGPVIEDNLRHWHGDHCVDPEQVPGVLFSSRRLEGRDPHIIDIAPTVLSLFGLEVPGYLQGRSLSAYTH